MKDQVMALKNQQGAHIIQTAGGQLMLQTVGGSGSIQVASANGQQLQQIQVIPASGLQVLVFIKRCFLYSNEIYMFLCL